MASSRSKNARKEEERNANFTAGDTVLGKAEGLPWWPGMIVDEGNVPDRVRDIKPVRKNPPVHVVRWYPKGDFDWVTERNLQLLKPPAIEAYLKRHHGDLDPKLYGIGRKDVRKAYKAASDPGKWLIDRVDKLARRRAKRQHEKEPLEIEDYPEQQTSASKPHHKQRTKRRTSTADADTVSEEDIDESDAEEASNLQGGVSEAKSTHKAMSRRDTAKDATTVDPDTVTEEEIDEAEGNNVWTTTTTTTFKQAQTGSKRKRSPPMPRAAGPSRQETTMENEEEVNAEVLPPKMRKLASPNWLPPVQSPVPYTLPWRRLVTYVPPVYGADYVGEFKLVPAFPTFGTSEPPGNVGVGQTNAAAHSSIATQPGTIDGSTGGAHGAKVQQPNNAAAKDGQETEQLEDVHPPSASIVNGADATNSMQPNEFTHDVHALSQTRIDELSQDGVACQARNWATQLEHMFLDEQGKLPSVEDMNFVDVLFKDMEEIELENDHLTYAGLPNVLRLIADLGSDCAPCDTRYDFKGRAGKLITRWSDQLRAHVRTTGTAGRGTDVKVDGGVNADEPHDEGCDVDVENKTELCL